MAVPILASAYAAGIVMCHHSGPHDIGAGVVIVGILDHTGPFVDHCEQKGFYKTVGNLNFFGVGQVSFIQMSHDIRDPGCTLEGWQSLCQGGI